MQEGNNVMEIKYLASHERIFSLISLNKRENDCKPTFLVKRGTELLPGLTFAKINFFIFRDMVKSLEYDVCTIIISNFD